MPDEYTSTPLSWADRLTAAPKEQSPAPASTSAATASEELFELGDPSIQRDESATNRESGDAGKLQVRWERPTDLAMRAASVSFRGSAQLHMLMHDRYRTMLRTVRTQAAQQLRRLPDPRSFGRRAPAPTSPEAQTPGLP